MRIGNNCLCGYELEAMLIGVGWDTLVKNVPFICPECGADVKVNMVKEESKGETKGENKGENKET